MRSEPAKPFLVDNRALGQEFCKRFMRKLKSLHRRGKLRFEDKLSGVEFTRHWSLHILPKGFTKTRYFGGYSSGQRKAFLALCQQLHPQPPVATDTPPEVAEVEVQEAEASDSAPCCTKCQRPMTLAADTRRPSWRDLFYGPDSHPWQRY